MIHDLKTWPEYFEAVASGAKPFEVRKDDRDFSVGDILHLLEYVPEEARFTGRHLQRAVTYRLAGPQFGIQEGFVVLGLGPVPALPF